MQRSLRNAFPFSNYKTENAPGEKCYWYLRSHGERWLCSVPPFFWRQLAWNEILLSCKLSQGPGWRFFRGRETKQKCFLPLWILKQYFLLLLVKQIHRGVPVRSEMPMELRKDLKRRTWFSAGWYHSQNRIWAIAFSAVFVPWWSNKFYV